MVAHKQLDEFVSRIRPAAGENLQSVILYGSAAAGDFNPEFSNLNLLCLLYETSFAKLSAIAPVVEWWHRQKHPAPLVMTQDELERSADVFSIELLDIQRHHRVLFGDDTLTGLRTNTSGEVIDTRGKVIAGLYCAGESQGGFAQHGLARCVVFGRVAGRSAAKNSA